MASRREYEMLFQLNAQLGGSYNSTFKSAQREIVAMQKEIQSLSKTQSDIASYQRQQSAVEATGKKLSILQQQYDNIQKEISETGEYSADLQNKLLSKQLQIDKTASSLDNQTQKLHQMTAALKEAGVSTDNLERESAELGGKIGDLQQKQEDAADGANNFGSQAGQAFGAVHEALVAAGIAVALKEIYEAFLACVDASVEFESVMTGVAKTTNFTDAEFAAMSADIKAMSTEIPAATDELAAIAETAGQLGIEKSNLLSFTEIMAMLGTATNMAADEAATMLAQFASITGMDPANYSNLGSTIVDLGNNFSTTERNITEMSQTIAAAGAISGMSEADITAIAAAVTSLGISSQNGGTQMTKLISDINSAVSSGEGLDGWASASHMSAEAFASAWGENAAGALDMFIHGLNDTYEAGGDVYSVLADLGITETRMVTAVTSLAKSGTRLTDTLGVANNAWSENNALMTEAEKRYATTASQQTMAQNAFHNLKIAVGDNFTPVLQKLYAIETDVFNGLADFVEKNPELIKAATAFVAVIGTATAALTAYAAIKKIVDALNLVPLFAAAGPIMAVVAAVAAVTAGIVALVSAANEGIPSVKELTEAAREMGEAMDVASTSYDNVMTSTLATASVADTYISKLEELEGITVRTDAENQEYHNTLALLCRAVPELATYINLETDAIDGGTGALIKHTEAWKKDAETQAYQEYLNTLYDTYNGVLLEAAENSIKLTEAQISLETANEKQTDTQERMNQLYSDAVAEAEAFNRQYGTMADATGYLTQEYYDLENSLYAVNDEVYVAEQSIKNYKKAIEEDTAATAEAQEQMDAAKEAVERLTGVTEEQAAAAAEAARQEEELQGVIAETTAEIMALTEAYSAAYGAAYDSISGQYALWDEAAGVVATSADTINSALESQITYWQGYNNNLQSLTDRSGEIAGLSDVIASFADGSADSVNAIAGMASASDEDLAAMVASWQELQTEQEAASGSIADLKTGFTTAMDELQTELAADIEAMDLGAEAAESGKATIQGFIDGAGNMLPTVQAAYARVAQAARNALSTTSGGTATGIPGYAVGTQAAAQGYALVGEKGPELVYFGGGEQVMTAEETAAMKGGFSASEVQAVAFAPRLMEYLSAMNGREAISAVSGGGISGSSPAKSPTFNVTYNVYGDDGGGMMHNLEGHNRDLRAFIVDVLEEERADADRRAYK